MDGETAESLGLTGHEHYTIDLPEDVQVGQVVTVHANSEKGSKEFQALVRFDAEADIRYYRHGGILPMVVRKTGETYDRNEWVKRCDCLRYANQRN